MSEVLDSYSETNQDTVISPALEPGQSFTTLNVAYRYQLTTCKFYLQLTAGSTYNLTAQIYAHSGTYGTSSLPTGAALATSNAVTTGLTGALALVTFTFSGVNQIYLSKNTYYVVTVKLNSGDGTVFAGVDNMPESHAGNFVYYSGSWTAIAAADLIFYVYGVGNGALTISSVSNGSTYPAAATTYYTATTNILVYAKPNRGYLLSTWTLNTVLQTSKASRFTVTVTVADNKTLTPAFALQYTASNKTLFANSLNKHKISLGVSNLNVTLHALSLGSQDSETGIPAKTYTDSTIEMMIVTKDNKAVQTQVGIYVSSDAVGYTQSYVREWDKITKGAKNYFVKTVKALLDAAGNISHYEADLTEEVLQ